MQTYRIELKLFDPESNSFHDDMMIFQAEDVVHAVNQLLDFYRTWDLRVGVIESVVVVQ